MLLRYKVAETVGQTVAWVEDNMTAREFAGWLGYFSIQQDEIEKARKKGEKGSNVNPKKKGGGLRLGNRKKVPRKPTNNNVP